MYTYISRRRALLFKGALLIGTVWLTVAVLIFMENKGEDRQQIHPVLYETDNELGDQVYTFAGYESNKESKDSKEEDPLEPAMSNDAEGGSVAASASYDDFSVRKGIKLYGEMGRPVVLPSNISQEIKKLVSEGWSKNAFNQYVSDLISVHRSLPDPRDEW